MVALAPWVSRQNSSLEGLEAQNIPLNRQWGGNITLDKQEDTQDGGWHDGNSGDYSS